MEFIVSIKSRDSSSTYQRIATTEREAESIAETARRRGEDPLILPRQWFIGRNRGDRN